MSRINLLDSLPQKNLGEPLERGGKTEKGKKKGCLINYNN